MIEHLRDIVGAVNDLAKDGDDQDDLGTRIDYLENSGDSVPNIATKDNMDNTKYPSDDVPSISDVIFAFSLFVKMLL